MTLDADAAQAPPKRPQTAADLRFKREGMVRWLSPAILVDAALRVVVSSLFGQYADRREFQAALDPDPGPPLAYGRGDEEEDGSLWLDFVADLGDGFDPTFAVASLLARPRLEFDHGGRRHALPRGRALIMGGDQVYPAATREEYENRFRGPYEAAFPWTRGRGPDLFAIPGNHDWYDGLTNFLRFFCAQREIGAWRTRQRRSYFALRLPHRWWLLAIDIQLDTFIDAPQLRYFQNIGLGGGDRVILVTAKPSWTKVSEQTDSGPHELDAQPDSYKNLHYFTEQVVAPAGAEVRAMISGDLHHYARYAAGDQTQLITAGGGGAYLYPTHELRPSLDLPGDERSYRLAGCFPAGEESSKLVRGALKLPVLAWDLCLLIAVLYALFGGSLFAALDAGAGFSAAVVAVALVIVGSLVLYAGAESLWPRIALGVGHGGAHLVLAAIPAVVLDTLLGADGGWMGLLVAVLSAVVGFGLGGVVFGLYLILVHPLAPRHVNEVLACQGIGDFKHFLRLRVDERKLTIYPIGIRRVPRRWEPAPRDDPEAPWLRPKDRQLAPELIEDPIEVPADRIR